MNPHPGIFPLPPGPGRPKGSKNKVTTEAKEFALKILRSKEYEDFLKRGLVNGTLAPAIVVMLNHYGYGKPRDHMEVSFPDGIVDLTSLPAAALIAEADRLKRELEETLLASQTPEPESEAVH